MEKRAVHFIASRTKNYADKRELMNMVNELLGIQYNIAKANRTDRKVQNLAAYINADMLRAIHKTMDRKKAYGIDKVTKEDYEKNLEENLANLVKRMKNGSIPQSESLARLMISMLSEQLRSCHFLKKRYGNQNKEMRQESK